MEIWARSCKAFLQHLNRKPTRRWILIEPPKSDLQVQPYKHASNKYKRIWSAKIKSMINSPFSTFSRNHDRKRILIKKKGGLKCLIMPQSYNIFLFSILKFKMSIKLLNMIVVLKYIWRSNFILFEYLYYLFIQVQNHCFFKRL